MTKEIAEKILQLRVHNDDYYYSWRRIASIICEENPEFIKEYWPHTEPQLVDGNQLLGIDLCRDAADILELPKDHILRD